MYNELGLTAEVRWQSCRNSRNYRHWLPASLQAFC